MNAELQTKFETEIKYNEIVLIKEEGQENAKSYYKGILKNEFGNTQIVLVPIQYIELKEIHKSHWNTYYGVKK